MSAAAISATIPARPATTRNPLDDPASDVRDEIALSGGMPELPDKIWFHKTAAAVIDADRCVGCGGCIAACPSRSIGVADDWKPTLVKMCTGCSACWDYCPMAGLRVERLQHLIADSSQSGDGPATANGDRYRTNGSAPYRSAYSAAAKEPDTSGQDGGAVTALLCELLETGFIDGAIVTKRIDAFQGEPFLATTTEELRQASKSVYHQSHPLKVLNEPLPVGVKRIAFVGTPCQISVLRALQRYPWKYRRSSADAVVLAIGLFCTRSFDAAKLEQAVSECGVDTSVVTKVDVREGELVVSAERAELLRRPVKEFHPASLMGCDECSDFGAGAADLAMGNLGSDRGRTTVIVRSHAGEEAWAKSAEGLEVGELHDLVAFETMAARNARRAVRSIHRDLDPEGPLWTAYTEHVDGYSASDRAVKAPAAFRSHHFEVTC